jgi:hypothetical protein
MDARVTAEGARTLDLSEVLTRPRTRLRPWDNHPSPQGHDDLATGIVAELVDSGWLEACR